MGAKKNNNKQCFIANDDVNVVTIIIIAPDKTGFGQQPRIQEGISYTL